MNDHELKTTLVTTMWQNGIVQGKDYQLSSTIVAMSAIPRSDAPRAIYLLENEMGPSATCPVIRRMGFFCLPNDHALVEDYLVEVCSDPTNAPQSMRATIRRWQDMEEDENGDGDDG